MERAGLADGGFIGVRVVYVNRRISLVSVDCPWPRKLTQHELGHQAVQARGMPERRQDHGDPWWRRRVAAR